MAQRRVDRSAGSHFRRSEETRHDLRPDRRFGLAFRRRIPQRGRASAGGTDRRAEARRPDHVRNLALRDLQHGRSGRHGAFPGPHVRTAGPQASTRPDGRPRRGDRPVRPTRQRGHLGKCSRRKIRILRTGEGQCLRERDQRRTRRRRTDPQPHGQAGREQIPAPHVRHDPGENRAAERAHPLDVHRLDGARRMQLGHRYPRRVQKAARVRHLPLPALHDVQGGPPGRRFGLQLRRRQNPRIRRRNPPDALRLRTDQSRIAARTL